MFQCYCNMPIAEDLLLHPAKVENKNLERNIRFYKLNAVGARWLQIKIQPGAGLQYGKAVPLVVTFTKHLECRGTVYASEDLLIEMRLDAGVVSFWIAWRGACNPPLTRFIGRWIMEMLVQSSSSIILFYRKLALTNWSQKFLSSDGQVI